MSSPQMSIMPTPIQGPEPAPTNPNVPLIRSSSRLLVRELGFLSSTLAGTSHPPSAVHALLEISSSSNITASRLCEILNLDKSSVSRMLRKLVDAGEVIESKRDGKGDEKTDKREKKLGLSEKGRSVVRAINEFASSQVTQALTKLPPPTTPEQVHIAIQAYALALRSHRQNKPIQPASVITIASGYQPGLLARCLEMHMDYYSRTAGFGLAFEAQLATGLGDLLTRLENVRNGVWAAVDAEGTRVLGTVFIDGEVEEGIAHLRAFIVDESARGRGVGRKLLKEAIRFVDQRGVKETWLWTFEGLDAARKLYEGVGFGLVEEARSARWGEAVLVQKFVRSLGGDDAMSRR